jgi:vesicular inhibitory amino acid transporter
VVLKLIGVRRADDSAKLLARLILTDRSLLGYTDIGKRAFGGWASGFINVL